jgi:hypothetical protein
LHKHLTTLMLWRLPSLLLLLIPASAMGGSVNATATLDILLRQLSGQVEQFWKEFPSVSCKETVTQFKLDEKARILNEKKSVYEYVIFMKLIGNELAIEEARELKSETHAKKKKRPQHRSLLETNGFATMLLVFHPHFQSSYVFSEGPTEVLDGAALKRIDFEQIRGERSPSALDLGDRTVPLEWKGTAWIDPVSASVVRLRTEITGPLADIGLQSLDSEVHYKKMTFSNAATPLWMPESAVIEARTDHQHWRNEHVFSDFQRFAVDTEVHIGNPDIK